MMAADRPLSTAVDERRQRVLTAVIVIGDHLDRMRAGRGVAPFHVRYFGVPECVTDVSLSTIAKDLRWLEAEGYVSRPRRKRAEYTDTDKGHAAWRATAEARP